ncbi:MAG: hypothetical protein ACE5Q6_19620, partial [Dehalococcoidia bacterium]
GLGAMHYRQDTDRVARRVALSRSASAVGAALVLAMLLGALSSHIVLAQEKGIERVNEKAGPYEITVWEDPSDLSAGRTSYTVRVIEGTTGEPVPDANVVIRFTHAVLIRYGRSTALSTPGSPGYYGGRINMYTPGEWRTRVEVTSSLGKATVELPTVKVPRLRSYWSGSFVFLALMGSAVLAGGYLWWRAKQVRRGRASSPTSEGLGKEGEAED